MCEGNTPEQRPVIKREREGEREREREREREKESVCGETNTPMKKDRQTDKHEAKQTKNIPTDKEM